MWADHFMLNLWLLLKCTLAIYLCAHFSLLHVTHETFFISHLLVIIFACIHFYLTILFKTFYCNLFEAFVENFCEAVCILSKLSKQLT